MFPPKKLSKPLLLPPCFALAQLTCFPGRVSRSGGQKIRGPIHLSQLGLSDLCLFRSKLTDYCTDRQLLSCSTGVALSNASTLARHLQGSTGFFTFSRIFFRPTCRTHKEQGVDNTVIGRHSKRFFEKNSMFS